MPAAKAPSFEVSSPSSPFNLLKGGFGCANALLNVRHDLLLVIVRAASSVHALRCSR